MATESQLRDLLVELEVGAPSVPDVLDALMPATPRLDVGSGRSRSRHGWAAAGAAAACAAVIVGVGAFAGVVGLHRAPTGDSAASRPPRAELLPSWHFAVGAVPGYAVTRDSSVPSDPVTTVTQRATVTATHGRVSGYLEVESAVAGESRVDTGNFRAAADGRLVRRHELRINGRAAYFVHGTTLTPGQLRRSTTEFMNSGPRPDPWIAAAGYASNQPQLYWQLSDKGTAELSGTFGFHAATASWNDTAALATMKRIAAATTSLAGDPVRVPFRLAADPSGLVPLTMFAEPHAQCLGYGTGTVTRATDPTWGWYELCRFGGRPPSGLSKPHHPVATRALADGTVLGLYPAGRPGQRTPITTSQAVALLHDADVGPTFDNPGTWLAVE